jgi:DNA-binding NarL/FixJ family response regulator
MNKKAEEIEDLNNIAEDLANNLKEILFQIKAYKQITTHNAEAKAILFNLEEKIKGIENQFNFLKSNFQKSENESEVTILSPREIEVIILVAKGLPNKQIAYQLNISDRTVNFHLKGIFNKTKTTSRTEAVVWAIKNLIVHL